MRKIVFIFMVFSLVSFSKSSEVIILKSGEIFSSCDKKNRNHLDELKDEWEKMNEIYDKLIQKFDKNNKLKEDLINSQKIYNYICNIKFIILKIQKISNTIFLKIIIGDF